jgi:hypothetical protein
VYRVIANGREKTQKAQKREENMVPTSSRYFGNSFCAFCVFSRPILFHFTSAGDEVAL